MARLVLASASPRRRAMLEAAGYHFEVLATGVSEDVAPGTPPEEAALDLARRKALAADAPSAFVLAADTLLDLDGDILGKPDDDAHAARILRRLQGREHRVLTGVAVRAPDGSLRAGVAMTRVRFRPLTDAEIAAYVATGESLGKAGAYAIQGRAAAFIERVDGDADTVIGLPMALATRLLREAGYPDP